MNSETTAYRRYLSFLRTSIAYINAHRTIAYRRYINPFRRGTDTPWGALPDRMAPQAGLFFKMLLLISACVNACTAIPASNLYTEHSLFEGRLSIHA
mgnify:CR=1 FL=1